MLDVPFQYIIHSREHHQAVAQLVRRLGNWFERNSWEPAWEALSQVKLDEAHTSPVPDVVICHDAVPVVLVEVTSATAFNQEFLKMTQLIEEYELPEGFLFDYQKNRWRGYRLRAGEVPENPSFCESIGHDLAKFVK